MKDNHGLKCNNQQVLDYFDIITPTMESDEVPNWLSNNQIITKPIDDIPILQGFGCSLCSYSAKKRTVIYNHISITHKNTNIKAVIVERKVQKPFHGTLKRYIQVVSSDDSEIEKENIEDWRVKLNEEFERLVEADSHIESVGNLDLKLINAFIAKIRYKTIILYIITLDGTFI